MEEELEYYLDTIKALINSGDINDFKKSITLLRKIDDSKQFGIENELILLNGRFMSNEGNFHQKGIIDYSAYKLQLAQIRYALLTIVDDIPSRASIFNNNVKVIRDNFEASNKSKKPLVFLIYDNNEVDRVFARELRAHLMPLERISHEISIDDIHEGNTAFGDQRKRWKDKIESAVLLLCLISPRFFVSKDDLFQLVKNANAQEKVVVPILIKATSHYEKSFLGDLGTLPSNKEFIASWSDRDEAYTEIVNTIQNYIQGL